MDITSQDRSAARARAPGRVVSLLSPLVLSAASLALKWLAGRAAGRIEPLSPLFRSDSGAAARSEPICSTEGVRPSIGQALINRTYCQFAIALPIPNNIANCRHCRFQFIAVQLPALPIQFNSRHQARGIWVRSETTPASIFPLTLLD